MPAHSRPSHQPPKNGIAEQENDPPRGQPPNPRKRKRGHRYDNPDLPARSENCPHRPSDASSSSHTGTGAGADADTASPPSVALSVRDDNVQPAPEATAEPGRPHSPPPHSQGPRPRSAAATSSATHADVAPPPQAQEARPADAPPANAGDLPQNVPADVPFAPPREDRPPPVRGAARAQRAQNAPPQMVVHVSAAPAADGPFLMIHILLGPGTQQRLYHTWYRSREDAVARARRSSAEYARLRIRGGAQARSDSAAPSGARLRAGEGTRSGTDGSAADQDASSTSDLISGSGAHLTAESGTTHARATGENAAAAATNTESTGDPQPQPPPQPSTQNQRPRRAAGADRNITFRRIVYQEGIFGSMQLISGAAIAITGAIVIHVACAHPLPPRRMANALSYQTHAMGASHRRHAPRPAAPAAREGDQQDVTAADANPAASVDRDTPAQSRDDVQDRQTPDVDDTTAPVRPNTSSPPVREEDEPQQATTEQQEVACDSAETSAGAQETEIDSQASIPNSNEVQTVIMDALAQATQGPSVDAVATQDIAVVPGPLSAEVRAAPASTSSHSANSQAQRLVSPPSMLNPAWTPENSSRASGHVRPDREV
ncbi:hypothetical protein WOLCODRAFT_17619 [Wolfiporia cocos MD-104 SS10]|uniref:Uncharacterized protein n=1 Tax=Wolfiporia cocos (strain MD-104) TaxID=742152 RepID=A0A2H3JWR7_WOLCO|nr:hypothetical protein WOLCODRAFT_17619 [Wolfiporia cocos MD-104 SS10]